MHLALLETTPSPISISNGSILYICKQLRVERMIIALKKYYSLSVTIGKQQIYSYIAKKSSDLNRNM